MARHRFLLGTAFITLVTAAQPLHAQRVEDWQYRWYWGANGGIMSYTLPTPGRRVSPAVGGEWLITQRRVALYLGYQQSFTSEQDTFQLTGLSGTQNVTFDGIRQIEVAVVTFIGNSNIQPYLGGGFVIETLTNARSGGAPNTTVDQAISDAASGGFLQLLAGVQYRMGRKAAIFANYQYTPQGRDFLLTGGAHTLTAGLRYAFLSSRENDPTTRR